MAAWSSPARRAGRTVRCRPSVRCVRSRRRGARPRRGEGAHALVLVLDALAATVSWRRRLVDAPARLDRRLRVGTEHHVAGLEQLAFPAALVEVEHLPRLVEEVGVAREDTRALLPRLDRVL